MLLHNLSAILNFVHSGQWWFISLHAPTDRIIPFWLVSIWSRTVDWLWSCGLCNLEHSWLSHFSVISFSVKYRVRWELCIGCPLILILHACSNCVVAGGSVILISGIQNVPFLFVLEGNILGRCNSRLEIGSNSKYLTLFCRKTYSFIMTLGNVLIYSS